MLRVLIFIPVLCLVGAAILYLTPEFNDQLPYSGKVTEMLRQTVSVSATAAPSRSPVYTRELLLFLMGCFGLKTAWNFFNRRSQNNPYGNYLEELPVAHRWTFFLYTGLIMAAVLMESLRAGSFYSTLSILCAASFIRKYYCDACFSTYPVVRLLHLALILSSVAVGLRMAQPSHGWLLIWMGLMFCVYSLNIFYNHPDWMEHRNGLFGFFMVFAALFLIGGALGYYLFHTRGMTLFCGALPVVGLVPTFYRWLERVVNTNTGYLVHDIVFSEGSFAEAPKRTSAVPSLALLNHWIKSGEVKKAWSTAKMHLYNEPESVPIWLFAMKVAVLHLDTPKDAQSLLKQFIQCTEIHPDHRSVAVARMQEWMGQAGHPFNPKDFVVLTKAVQPSTLEEKVDQHLQAGDIGRAEGVLTEALKTDCLNEAAFIRLVRLYAQEKRDIKGAERLIADARHTFGPSLLDMLGSYIHTWHELSRTQSAEGDGRIKLISVGETQRPPDPIEEYLKRVREGQKAQERAVYSDAIGQAIAEHRYGTAIDLLEEKTKADPHNFELWLRYAETYAVHCNSLSTAEKILRKMKQSRAFTEEQMGQAHGELVKWQTRH